MQVELSPESQAKLEDILDQMATYHDLEELTAEELLDALLEIGLDLIMAEDASMQVGRDRLMQYCTQKVASRG